MIQLSFDIILYSVVFHEAPVSFLRCWSFVEDKSKSYLMLWPEDNEHNGRAYHLKRR